MATAQKLTEHFLTCPICSEVLNQPCSLGCQHNFCRDCLNKYIQTQPDAIKARSIPCPFCRLETRVPHPQKAVEEWAAQFTPGLVIRNLVDSFGRGKDTDLCTLCKEEGERTPASFWCSECDASLCDGCLKLHHKIPASRHHEVSHISTEGKTLKKKKRFVCKKHSEERVKLFCKDHKQAICTVCCSIEHRACKEVVAVQDIMPEVKATLLSHKVRFHSELQVISHIKTEREKVIKTTADKATHVKFDIKTAVKKVVDMIEQREKKLLDEVDDTMDKQLGQLTLENKLAEMSILMFQQQSEAVDQAINSECETDMYGLYELYQSAQPDDVTHINAVPEMKFTDNIEEVRDAVDKMSIRFDECIDLLAKKPVLVDTIEVKMHSDRGNPDLRDVMCVKVNDVTAVVVTDFSNNVSIMSIYMQSGQLCYSHLKFDSGSWSLTKLRGKTVAVTVPGAKQIVIVDVTPDLKILSTINTKKGYYGIAAMNHLSIAASCLSPPSVDILDTSGNVTKSFTTLPGIKKTLANPWYLLLTHKGNILISDPILKSVICLTPTGELVFDYNPSGDRGLRSSVGMATTSTRDILIADHLTKKVTHLTETGDFVRDILTSHECTDDPFGLTIDRDELYVAFRKSVKVFKLK